jgi:tetratricopeptide (TPR) repeat protein
MQQKMRETIERIRTLTHGKAGDGRTVVHVYRRHVARAIAEERWTVAEIFLDRILETDPRNTEAWLVKGWLRHHCRDDGNAAVGCYRKVISLCGHDLRHPHARRARTSLGRLLASMG